MGDPKYDIVFRGKLVSGVDESLVRARLAKMFKADESKVAALFSGERKVLKRGLDRDTADKYRDALKKAGAVVAIVSARLQEQAREKPVHTPPTAPEPSPDFGREIKPAYEGRASFQIDESPPASDPEPEPESESEPAREIKAAYDGKASFQIDETPPEPEPEETETEIKAAYEGKAAYQVDESDGSEDAGAPGPEPEDDDGDLEFEAGLAPKADAVAEHQADIETEAPPGAMDGALEFESVPIGDADLAPPGEQIVESERVEPPEIDTSGLSTDEDYDVLDESEKPPPPDIDTGTLATEVDYDALDESERPPPPDIDTGNLDVLEVGTTVDESPPPQAVEIDTSGLSVDEDFEGLAEDDKPAEPDIDISRLSLADDDD